MSREIFEKLGIDLSNINKETVGFFRGLTAEFQKNVQKFNAKSTQTYFNNFIAALMLEYHKAYENFDIKVPYRIKSAKSAFDKVLDYFDKPGKHYIDDEYRVRLNEDLTDMLGITIVACNRPPTFYSNNPEINDLIEEKKKNHTFLGTMQKYRLRITDSEFSGLEPSTYSYNNNSTKEEYYLNCILLINRIKSLIHPDSKNLHQKYDNMLNKIKENIPEYFFEIANSISRYPNMATRNDTEADINAAYEIAKNISAQRLDVEDLENFQQPITPKDVEVVDFLGLTDDFTARIHDKLDLALLKKQVYSIFQNSEIIKKFGVTICPESEKLKRTADGYVSDFVYLDTPFGKIEMQLQSQHEHEEGNYGYAAHSNMDRKGFKELEIPPRNDREKIKDFRTCVEFISPKKFLAQFDSTEPNRILTQVFGKYQNYKSIMMQVTRGSESEKRLIEYFSRVYTRRNELFTGEARQEMIESFVPFDIELYLKSKEFKKIMAQKEQNIR